MSQENQKTLLCLLGVALLTLVLLMPVMNGKFVNWDDDEYILQNELIRELSPENIKNIFVTDLHGKYQPLALLSYAIEYQLFGQDPFVFHSTNLLLHTFNTLLVFVFAHILLGEISIALVASLLFGIHPLQVEPVAWISSRKDMLFLFFYLSGLIAYLRCYKQHEDDHPCMILTYVFFVLSLFSKAMAVSYPLVLILVDYLKDQQFRWRKVWIKWPLFALAILYGIFTLSNVQQAGAFPNTVVYSFGEQLLYSCVAFLLYIFKVVIPYPLSAFYPPEIPMAMMVLSVIGVLLGAVLIGINFRKDKTVIFCFLFYVLTIWPVLHLFKMNDSLIYERFMYLPSIGFFILIGYAIHCAWAQHRQWLRLAAVLIFCVWFVFLMKISRRQTYVWHNSGALWANVIDHFPHAYPAYYKMGTYMESQFRYEEAQMYFMRLIETEPRYAEGYFKLANMLSIKFDRSGAIRYYSKAIEYNPQHYKAYNNRGNQYLMSGMYELARQDYTKALEIAPDYLNARVNRGMCYFALQDYPKAVQDFQEVLKVDPQHEPARQKIQYMQANNLL